MITLAKNIAEMISSDDVTAVIDYVPDFSLKDLSVKKILIVPVDVEWHNITRGGAKRIFAFEIGIMQRIDSEDDIEGCIEVTIGVGDKLRNSQLGGCRCVSVDTEQLYDPMQYKQSKVVTGILRVRFSEL